MHSPTFAQTLTVCRLESPSGLLSVTTRLAMEEAPVTVSKAFTMVESVYVGGNGQMSDPAVAGKVFLLSSTSFYLTG